MEHTSPVWYMHFGKISTIWKKSCSVPQQPVPRRNITHEGFVCKMLEAYVWACRPWQPQSCALQGALVVPYSNFCQEEMYTQTCKHSNTWKKYTETHFQNWKLKSWEPLFPSHQSFHEKASSHFCKTPQRAEKAGGLAKVTPTKGEGKAESTACASSGKETWGMWAWGKIRSHLMNMRN